MTDNTGVHVNQPKPKHASREQLAKLVADFDEGMSTSFNALRIKQWRTLKDALDTISDHVLYPEEAWAQLAAERDAAVAQLDALRVAERDPRSTDLDVQSNHQLAALIKRGAYNGDAVADRDRAIDELVRRADAAEAQQLDALREAERAAVRTHDEALRLAQLDVLRALRDDAPRSVDYMNDLEVMTKTLVELGAYVETTKPGEGGSFAHASLTDKAADNALQAVIGYVLGLVAHTGRLSKQLAEALRAPCVKAAAYVIADRIPHQHDGERTLRFHTWQSMGGSGRPILDVDHTFAAARERVEARAPTADTVYCICALVPLYVVEHRQAIETTSKDLLADKPANVTTKTEKT